MFAQPCSASSILNYLPGSGGRVARCLVRVLFYRVPAMRKITCKFKYETKSKESCYRSGRNQAECVLCKPRTYVSAANKGACDLQATS
jgi:hypothetical protein